MRAAVIGLGRMGRRIAYELSREGVDVIGIDADMETVENVKYQLDIDAFVVDATNLQAIEAALLGIRQAVTALPGYIGFEVLKNLVELGMDIVDISFYREDPEALAYRARKLGAFLVVDAGVAPGLSNFLIGLSDEQIGPLEGARIFVGGVSKVKKDPLGLAMTWSPEDLMDEYQRPARMIKNGELLEVSPLSISGTVKVPGFGTMEFFPTDGLRSLLKTYGELKELVEYTLRWPGHLETIRLLRDMGFFDNDFVIVRGCAIRPKDVLARLIERRYLNTEDLVVMVVETWSKNDRLVYKLVVEPREGWSAMARATAGFASAVTLAMLEGLLSGEGVRYPEMLSKDEDVRDFILSYLKRQDIMIEELGDVELEVHISEEPSS
jgi:saccharopine dehydrogenase-like NADP-dependent oxidoreductase